jgi:hypothetical protein
MDQADMPRDGTAHFRRDDILGPVVSKSSLSRLEIWCGPPDGLGRPEIPVS